MAINKDLRVLVVDDFPSMRSVIKGLLRKIGFREVFEANDGAEAWDMLSKEPIDFIISDWNMPEMTGLELLNKVRGDEKLANTPFLMVTAEAEKDRVLDAYKAKVSDYILKPFTMDVLEGKIASILEKS